MRLLKPLLVWFTNTKFYAWLLLSVIPYIRFTTYYTSFRGWKYHRGYNLLKPGHILLARDDKKLTTVLIGGMFTHAAFCVGKFGTEQYPNFEVAEMTHENFTHSHFFDICNQADRVVILECKDFDPEYTQKVIEKCLSFKDATYNVQFDLGIKALYCSELVYQADYERRLQVNLEDLAGLGQQYISPTGLYKGKNVVVIWDSSAESGN